MCHYIYFHITNDSHEVFYVGQGKLQTTFPYKRAHDTKTRTKLWKNTTAKHGYHIEIVAEDLTKEQADVMERFWIQSFGRRDKKEGTLVNLTEGGDANPGRIPWNKGMKGSNRGPSGAKSPEHRAKLSAALKGKPLSEETKAKMKGRVPWNKGFRQPSQSEQ